MTKILEISEINTEQWNDLLNHSLVASFFQTRECYDFYASLSFLEPFVFGISENDKLTGLICGYIIADGGKIKRFFSRRAIVPGGALLAENISDEALSRLLQFTIKNIRKKAIYIEIRNYFDYSDYKKIFSENGFTYNEHLNFRIRTESEESCLKQLHSSKRRAVKLTQKGGVEVFEIADNEDLRRYYAILEHLYKTKVKTPLYPFEFFEKIVELPSCKLLAIKKNNEILGGSVCVFSNDKAVYQWFACGIDGKYKNTFSSTFATWAGISFAATNGFEYFDLMGAGKTSEPYGVRTFKAEFGGELVEHGRFLFVCKPILYNLGKKIISIIKRK